MKAIYTVLFFVFFTSLTQAQDAFITKWETSPDINEDPYVTIPTHPNETYDYNVDWGDGNNSTNLSGDATHVYASSGTKTVTITGIFPRIYLNNGSESLKIASIDQWGTGTWTSMEKAFFGAENLVMAATDSPDLTQVTSMKEMFRNARVFNGDVSGWDTSSVTDMSSMFRDANLFNQDISGWDTSMVININHMFLDAAVFNQDIGGWDTSKVTSMVATFRDADVFNQDIGGWNTSLVTDMNYMFHNANAFNQDIGGWDTSKVTLMNNLFRNANAFNGDVSGWDISKVTNMNNMFRNAFVFNQDIGGWDTSMVRHMTSTFRDAAVFNQDIGGWDTSSVSDMSQMFYNAEAFDQNIGSWDVASLTNAANMFQGATLSSENYDALLAGWAAQSLQTGVNFHGGNSQYCATDEHHTTLTQTYGWNITDGGPCESLNATEASLSNPTIFLQPNPAKEQFYIKGLKEKTLLRSYDPRGSLLLEREYTSGTPVDISTWASGLYTVQLINSQGIQTRRLVK